MHSKYIFFSITLAIFGFQGLAIADDTESNKRFNETLSICLNLDGYGTLALKARESGMPLKTSTEMIENSMKTNLASMPIDMLSSYIDVVKDLYKIVHDDKTIEKNNIDSAIFKACSKYHSYGVDTSKLKSELSKYVQSAFDPLKRVPICQKAGETAANIATARDKGMKKDEILKVAAQGLGGDEKTKEILPSMIEEIYKSPEIEVPSFYLYYINSCNETQNGNKFIPINEISSQIVSCQKINEKNEKVSCLKISLGIK